MLPLIVFFKGIIGANRLNKEGISVKSKKERKVEIYIIEAPNPEQRLKRVTEILAEGIFTYLEENGYFREDNKEDEKPPLTEPISA